MGRLFRNKNGQNYCILEGGFGKPTLLASMNNINEYVVVGCLGLEDWSSGMYILGLEKAYEMYKKRL